MSTTFKQWWDQVHLDPYYGRKFSAEAAWNVRQLEIDKLNNHIKAIQSLVNEQAENPHLWSTLGVSTRECYLQFHLRELHRFIEGVICGI